MRSRKSAHEEVAEVARRRLALLSAELAEIRPAAEDTPNLRDPGGSGEPHDADPSTDPSTDRASPGAAIAGKHAHRSVGVTASLGGWTHDRLPAPLQGRLRLTAGHLAVVALLVAGALGLTAWWVVRADGGSTTLPPVTTAPVGLVSVSPAGPAPPVSPGGATAPPTAASPSGSIVVDVAGKVRRPGIATLPLGSRVVDALEAAGGTRPGARLGPLNLARVLTDGEQVVVGQPGVPGVAASAAAAPGAGSTGTTPMVNLNSATQAQLEELPGVGPVTAQAILAFRTEQGPFTAVDELLEVSGIGDATLAQISPFVTL